MLNPTNMMKLEKATFQSVCMIFLYFRWYSFFKKDKLLKKEKLYPRSEDKMALEKEVYESSERKT